MILSMGLIWGLVAILGFMTYRSRRGLFSEALRFARTQAFVVLPRMPMALIAAGFLAELMPEEQISGWIGSDSGFLGVLIAAGLGAIVPSGPIISFPVAIALMHLGAGVPQLVTFLTAWSLFGVQRTLMWEAPLMGWSFVSRLMTVSIPGPFIAALVAMAIGAVFQMSS